MIKVCRICLSRDGRLYPIESNDLQSIYHELTGIPKQEVEMEKRLPQWVCAECGLRLMSYNKLRLKSLRAHQILCDILDKATYITENELKQIDRETNDLQSSLNYSVLDGGIIQEYAIELEEVNDSELKQEIKVEQLSVEFESEDSELVTETNDIVNEESDEATNDSASEKRSGSDYEPGSSDSSVSLNEFSKTRDRKQCLEIKKRVERYMDRFQKRINERVKKTFVEIEVDGKEVDQKELVRKKEKDPFVFEDYFTIKVCSLEEQMEAIEMRRYSTNYNNAPFKCDECYKGFGSKVTLSRHTMYHSEKRGRFECSLCKFKYPAKKYYLRHMEAHKYRFSCKLCNFTSNRRCVSINHGLKHTGKVYNCPHCDMKFDIISSYLTHIRIKHVSDFVCEFCGFAFLSSKGVEQHKSLKHTLEKGVIVTQDSPTCPTCSLRFISDEALNTHIRVSHAHTPGGKMRNDNVSSQFIRAKPVQCELCGLELRDGRSYRGHFRRNHPTETPTQVFSKYKPKPMKPCMCDQCGRVFKSNANLIMHSVVHTGLKPYECSECDAKYSFKTNLQQHILRAHRPDKDNEPKMLYPCDICSKKFANRSNVVRHMALHTGLRPFTCEVCGKTFKSKPEVYSHTAHVHLKKPWPKKTRGINQRERQCL